MIEGNLFAQGWLDADEAIKNKLPGYQDYSQGWSLWDHGWNGRLDEEKGKNDTLTPLVNHDRLHSELERNRRSTDIEH